MSARFTVNGAFFREGRGKWHFLSFGIVGILYACVCRNRRGCELGTPAKLLKGFGTIAAVALLLIAPLSSHAFADPVFGYHPLSSNHHNGPTDNYGDGPDISYGNGPDISNGNGGPDSTGGGGPNDSYDPLHGFCVSPLDCQDNGIVTPITTTDTPTFGFSKSPDSGSGMFFLDVLIPNSVANASTQSITISGINTGNATATGVQMGNWTSGDLTAFLGRSTSPTNPLDGWLPTTQQFQKTATGYIVYDFTFGNVSYGQGKPPTFSSTFAYPAGTIITAFLCASTSGGKCTSWVSTAQSAALAVEYQAKKIPEPASLVVLLVGLLGISAVRLRRTKAAAG